MTDTDQPSVSDTVGVTREDVNPTEEEKATIFVDHVAENKSEEITTVMTEDATTDSAQDTSSLMECDKADEDKEGKIDTITETEQSIVTVNTSFAEMSVNPNVRVAMLARVAVSDAHFKHQQRGDPDLSMEEKIEIAQGVLDTNKVNFLSRFGQFLELEDLEYFKNDRNIYEIDFYVKQIMKNKSGKFSRNRIKNRRFAAMKQLVSDGEYFSNDEMKFREPYLFEQMVGQYLTEAEVQSDIDKADLRFSTILIKHMDQLNENARFAVEKDKELRTKHGPPLRKDTVDSSDI